jgi:hypothetical protein
MKKATVIAHGGNKYSVTIGTTVKFDIDGISFIHNGATDGEGLTRDEFISGDDDQEHATALMDYLHIES